MKLLYPVPLLALGLLLSACSGSDAPPTPKVANAAEVTAPAPAVPQSSTTPAATEPSPAAAAPAPVPPPSVEAAPTPTATPEETPATPATAPASAATGDPRYEVSCPPGATAAEQCQVDKDTYIGWRTFSGQCQVCHGGSALGSTFAPNLLDRFHERVDHARFIEVVTNGFRGQVGAMPAWRGNPNVIPHIDQLYRYLKARADGVLPAGRPERKP